MCKLILRRFRLIIVVVEKQLALHVANVSVIQHAERMRRIIPSSAACLAQQQFSTLFINDTIVGKTSLLNIKRVV
jgi:hypothetical protein